MKVLFVEEEEFEELSPMEIQEILEYESLSQDLDDESSVFQDKLEMYRGEI